MKNVSGTCTSTRNNLENCAEAIRTLKLIANLCKSTLNDVIKTIKSLMFFVAEAIV